MKAFITFALSFVLARAETVYDLIILSGQSNAVGFDAKPSDLPKSPLDQRVLLWWKIGDPPPDDHDSSSNAWKQLAPQPLGKPALKKSAPRQYGNFAQPGGGFGPEVSFARHLLEKDLNRKIAILKVAFSGTSIPRDWDPKKSEEPTSCYAALLAEFKRASKAASERNITLRPAAFLWVQGESDANVANAPRYARDLTELLAALREEFKTPTLPALVAVNTQFGLGKNKFMPAIVEAQKKVAASDPLTHYIDTSKAPVINAAHFSSKGTIQVGKQFAARFLDLETP